MMYSFSTLIILCVVVLLLIFLGLYLQFHKVDIKNNKVYAVLSWFVAVVVAVIITINQDHFKTTEGMYKSVLNVAEKSQSSAVKGYIYDKTVKGYITVSEYDEIRLNLDATKKGNYERNIEEIKNEIAALLGEEK